MQGRNVGCQRSIIKSAYLPVQSIGVEACILLCMGLGGVLIGGWNKADTTSKERGCIELRFGRESV